MSVSRGVTGSMGVSRGSAPGPGPGEGETCRRQYLIGLQEAQSSVYSQLGSASNNNNGKFFISGSLPETYPLLTPVPASILLSLGLRHHLWRR